MPPRLFRNSNTGSSADSVILNPLGHFLVEIRGSQTNDETGWENKRQVSVGRIPLIRRRKLATRIFYHILRLLSTFPSVSMQLKLRVAHTLLATSHIERCVHCRDPMCASPHCTVQCILRIITLHFTRETWRHFMQQIKVGDNNWWRQQIFWQYRF